MTKHSGQKKSIIIDDDQEIRSMVEKILNQKGYSTIVAPNALRLVATLKKESIDIVFLDINLPWLSGIDVCQLIRKEESIKGTKIVFMTGLKMPEKKYKESGCDGVLKKPFTINDIDNLLAEKT